MAEGNVLRSERLILIELNEINFEVAKKYAVGHRLPSIQRLLNGLQIETRAESQYEFLEPWIQWPSAHCGLTADEHQIFRLGDIVHSSAPQLFEQLEQQGLRVGAVSPMNAANRMVEPAYFIPDPWTKTPTDRTWWSRVMTEAVSQTVNDNSKNAITPKSALHLALALLRFAQPRNWSTYLKLALHSRGAPWRKALLLDLLLHDIHLNLFLKQRANFSTLFLNAGAHIQHHYFFNAAVLRDQVSMRNPEWYLAGNEDPIAEMLEIYDRIIGDYLEIPGVETIVATGLSQKPYDRVKFYYRLRDHATFLQTVGIRYEQVLPRMTRDFLLEFTSAEEARTASERLSGILVDGKQPLFGEIDNRGGSLFVTLTYPHEILDSTRIEVGGRQFSLRDQVVFVAIKNGMHQEKGYAFFTSNLTKLAPDQGAHVKELYRTIMSYFRAPTERAG